MLRIKIDGWIDTLKDGRDVLRKEVSLFDENGFLVGKINLPTAERLIQASREDDEPLGDFAGRLDSALKGFSEDLSKTQGAKVGATRRKKARKMLVSFEEQEADETADAAGA